MMTIKITYRELANAVVEVDTADWSKPHEVIRDHIWSDFEDIAHHREKDDGGRAMVVSHELTTSFLLSLIDVNLPAQMVLENGSVTASTYEGGTFTIQGINDISYIEKGKKIAEKHR